MSNRIIEAKVVGGAEVARNFADKGGRLRDRMRTTMNDLGSQLRSGVESHAPKGETGKLKENVRLRMRENAYRISATVSARQYYARPVEQGYGPTDERVKGYWRKFTPNSRFGVLEKKRLKRSTKIEFGMTAQGIVWIRPHNRTGRAAPRPFMQTTVEEMRDQITSRILATALGTIQET